MRPFTLKKSCYHGDLQFRPLTLKKVAIMEVYSSESLEKMNKSAEKRTKLKEKRNEGFPIQTLGYLDKLHIIYHDRL